jgi:hypothetical protein
MASHLVINKVPLTNGTSLFVRTGLNFNSYLAEIELPALQSHFYALHEEGSSAKQNDYENN